MKQTVLFFAFIAVVQTAYAQASKVPEVVKLAFAKAYPNADDVKWERENGNFEVEFELADDQEMSVLYDANGALLETESEIPFSDLPQSAQEALKGKKVKETTRITSANGVVTYEAEVRHKDLMFDAQGRPRN